MMVGQHCCLIFHNLKSVLESFFLIFCFKLFFAAQRVSAQVLTCLIGHFFLKMI